MDLKVVIRTTLRLVDGYIQQLEVPALVLRCPHSRCAEYVGANLCQFS
jgi:hypothetical protein